jgi:hypothetical protein
MILALVYGTIPFIDKTICLHVMFEIGEGPSSPSISFRVLFVVIQDNISSVARELIFHHYEELKVILA